MDSVGGVVRELVSRGVDSDLTVVGTGVAVVVALVVSVVFSGVD